MGQAVSGHPLAVFGGVGDPHPGYIKTPDGAGFDAAAVQIVRRKRHFDGSESIFHPRRDFQICVPVQIAETSPSLWYSSCQSP